LLPQHARIFEHPSRNEALIKACVIPWFSFGKSVITVYLPELRFMSLEIRISVRNQRHRDGRGQRAFWTPCKCARNVQPIARERGEKNPDLIFRTLTRSSKSVFYPSSLTDSDVVGLLNIQKLRSVHGRESPGRINGFYRYWNLLLMRGIGQSGVLCLAFSSVI
jgi:hypothetical protein